MQGSRGVIITGQPGTGKTLFQYYLLVRLLQQKQVVLFSLDGDRLYLFYNDEVYVHQLSGNTGTPRSTLLPKPRNTLASNVFIWSLFDVEEQNGPKTLLVSRPCLPVQTASPSPQRYKTWQKVYNPRTTGLPLWTRDELAEGLTYHQEYHDLWKALCKDHEGSSSQVDPLRAFPGVRELIGGRGLLPDEAINYLLEVAIHRFGYSARDVFSAIFDPIEITQRHEAAFYMDLKATVDAVLGDQIGASRTTAHQILALNVVNANPITWVVNFKSDWVAKSIVQRAAAAEGEFATLKYIPYFRQIPQARAMADWFFEPLAHCYIAEISMDGSWSLINMAPSIDTNPPRFVVSQNPSPIPDGVQFAKVEREVIKFRSITDLPNHLKTNVYYRPEVPDFPLFDAFTVDIDHSKKSAILWVLQITPSRLNGGFAKGYEEIRMIVARLRDQLREDAPPVKTMRVAARETASTPLVQVRYLLVVPEGEAQNLQWDFPKEWSNDQRGDVYCLPLSLPII